jgi:SAM-dependent methyltransferase
LSGVPKDFSSITEFPGRKVGRDRMEIIGRRYLFAADVAAGKRVLEVGCGPGLGLGYLTGVAAWIVAGDITTVSLARAWATYRGRPGIRLVQFDAHVLPFRDASFDLVLAMAMICYLDVDVFLAECRRVLMRGGAVVFCTPNPEIPGFRPSRFSTRYYSGPELAEVARQHGFALELFGGFPAPRGRARLAQRAIAWGGTVLAALPLGLGNQERLREIVRQLIRYDARLLDGELTHEHMAIVRDIPLVPLRPDRGTAEYRILYGIARRSGGSR